MDANGDEPMTLGAHDFLDEPISSLKMAMDFHPKKTAELRSAGCRAAGEEASGTTGPRGFGGQRCSTGRRGSRTPRDGVKNGWLFEALPGDKWRIFEYWVGVYTGRKGWGTDPRTDLRCGELRNTIQDFQAPGYSVVNYLRLCQLDRTCQILSALSDQSLTKYDNN